MFSVRRIFVHPVKSARAVEVDAARLVARGLEHDRRWMIVDERGDFVTQRELPGMAMMSAEVDAAEIVLGFSGLPSLRAAIPPAGETREVVVWGDRCAALSAGAAASAWLERALGRRADLVFLPDSADRRTPAHHDPTGSLVSFADAFPLLVLSVGSVRDLSDRVGRPLDVRRFRPNLVIDGCEPYAEDQWRTIAIGDVVLKLVKPCSRCTIVNVDPDTAETSKEPLATLAGYRGRDHKVLFGHNAVVLSSPPHASIRAGDEVRVVEHAVC